jgi:hypothetical protein
LSEYLRQRIGQEHGGRDNADAAQEGQEKDRICKDGYDPTLASIRDDQYGPDGWEKEKGQDQESG